MLSWVWLQRTKASCALCWLLCVLVPSWTITSILRDSGLVVPPGSHEKGGNQPKACGAQVHDPASALALPLIRPPTSSPLGITICSLKPQWVRQGRVLPLPPTPVCLFLPGYFSWGPPSEGAPAFTPRLSNPAASSLTFSIL